MRFWIHTFLLPFSADNTTIIHSENGSQFPACEDNPDYQQYLVWLAEGNTPEEWNPETNTDTIEGGEEI